MKRYLTIGVALVAAAASAGAGYYLDERFSAATFPPPGWSWIGNGGTWQLQAGPWGNCAQGLAFGQPNYDIWAQLDTFPFNVAAGTTIYYRFDYKVGVGGYGFSAAYFELRNANTTALLRQEQLLVTGTVWRVHMGSVPITSAQPVFARWRVTSAAEQHSWASVSCSVDTAQISDEVMTAMAPASLGRVKALYR